MIWTFVEKIKSQDTFTNEKFILRHIYKIGYLIFRAGLCVFGLKDFKKCWSQNG
jgi:hypothetical protein